LKLKKSPPPLFQLNSPRNTIHWSPLKGKIESLGKALISSLHETNLKIPSKELSKKTPNDKFKKSL
jgi:hypothetical protein